VVINVSDPTDPTLVGGYDTSGYAWGVAVAGDNAYIADEGSGLVVVDVSDPTDPTFVGGYDTLSYAEGVTVAGGYAYAADGGNGLVVIDVSNKSYPLWVGDYDTSGSAYGVAVSGGYAYVADGYGGLMVINVSDPADLTFAGSYNTSGSAYGVAVSGNYAYVANGSGGLVVVNVSDSTDPTLVGGYDTSGSAYDVAIFGNYAYIADDDDGLVVVDVSDPADPFRAGGYNTNGRARGVAVAGDNAYVVDGSGGLVVVDVSDPTKPAQVGGYDTDGWARGVVVAGGYAYVADRSSGLAVVDVSNPTNPTQSGGYDTTSNALGVTVTGDYAYVIDSYGGLQVLHIRLPLSATIDTISPSPANEGDTVSFLGHGFDPDGTVAGYLWRSSLDGNLSTNASFNTSSLSVGTHTIYFQVQAENGNWTEEEYRTLKVNSFPNATIDSISPSPANEGEVVTFDGNGTDPDGTVVAYRWRSSLDGNLSTNATFTTSSLSPGVHTLYFSVQDNDGAWSPWVNTTFIVNLPPTAVIDSVSPPAVTEGEPVLLNGSGGDPDGTVVGHRWRSSLVAGNLSTNATFTTSDLPPGNHTLYFAVQDDLGFWSQEMNVSLHINARPLAVIANDTAAFAHADEPVLLNGSGTDADGQVVEYLWESDCDGPLGNGPHLTLTNLTSGSHNLSFSVRDDFGAWSGAAVWSLRVNARPSLVAVAVTPRMVLEGGVVTLTVNASDSDGNVTRYSYRLDHSASSFNLTREYNVTDHAPLDTAGWPGGNHTLAFRVGDSEGGWSDAVLSWLYVNVPPLAAIDEVSVARAANGSIVVTLAGQGEDDEAITAIEWRSDIDGFLGRGSPLVLYNLTTGTHTLSLRVQDEWGEWSGWVAWGEPVVVPAGTGGETASILGLEGNTLLLMVMLLAVTLGGGLAGWQYQSHIHATRIQPTLERLRSLTEQTRLAGLEYPRDQFQRVMESLTIWRYRSMQAEAALLEKRLSETLDLFVEVKGLLGKARELAAEAETAGIEFERARLESVEGAFEARELEDSKWAAAAFIEKVEGLLADSMAVPEVVAPEAVAPEAVAPEAEPLSSEPRLEWARPEGRPEAADASSPAAFSHDGEGALVCQGCGSVTEPAEGSKTADEGFEHICPACGAVGPAGAGPAG